MHTHIKYIDTFSVGKNVHLSFLTFEMEDEQDCGYDFIEIFSGFDDTAPSYGRFCGNKIPPEIISVDDALLLRYNVHNVVLLVKGIHRNVWLEFNASYEN